MPPPDKFMNTYQSRFDAKGRISIPAPFRTVLRTIASDGSATLMLRPSHTHACIEAWPPSRFEAWAERQREQGDPNADEDDLAIRLFSDTIAIEPDKEGRIVLDSVLVQHAGLTESVACLGLGDRFQLWDPAAAERRKSAARGGKS
jgi:MraZ protein